MTDRKRQQRDLNAAGFSCLTDLWVPAVYADTVRRFAGFYRAEVEAIKRGETPPPHPTPRPLAGGWMKRTDAARLVLGQMTEPEQE